MLIYFAIFVLIILFLLHVHWSTCEVRNLPGPKGYFLIGNALDIASEPKDNFLKFRKFAETYDGIYLLWVLGVNVVNIYNPQDIETVLGSSKHGKKGLVYSYFKKWLRGGLLMSSGTKWHQRRKILTPAFHHNILRQFCKTMNERSCRLVKSLKQEGDAVDLMSLTSEFSLNNLCETAMGMILDERKAGEGTRYKNAIDKLTACIYKRAKNVFLIPEFTYNISALARKIDVLLETIHSFTKNVVIERRKLLSTKIHKDSGIGNDFKKKKIALLDLLLLAEAEGVIDDEGVQEEVDNFMFEGYDTTARGLTFCLMLIANHRDIQNKLRAEFLEVIGDPDGLITLDDLPKLKYLECCIKETLRLYPPVPVITRETTEDITLCNCTIKAGTNVHVLIYDLHRRKDLYEDPLVFNPDRFLPENSRGRHNFAFLPFSAGPRNCIGQKFAMMEMKVCLSLILQNYELQPITRHEDIQFQTDFVLRSLNPLMVKFISRRLENGSN